MINLHYLVSGKIQPTYWIVLNTGNNLPPGLLTRLWIQVEDTASLIEQRQFSLFYE